MACWVSDCTLTKNVIVDGKCYEYGSGNGKKVSKKYWMGAKKMSI
jgi:hypothetical protein